MKKTSTNKKTQSSFEALLEAMIVAKMSPSEMAGRWRQLDTGNRPLRTISHTQYARTWALLAKIESAADKLCCEHESLSLDEVTLKAICGIQEYVNYARVKVIAQRFSTPPQK